VETANAATTTDEELDDILTGKTFLHHASYST